MNSLQPYVSNLHKDPKDQHETIQKHDFLLFRYEGKVTYFYVERANIRN